MGDNSDLTKFHAVNICGINWGGPEYSLSNYFDERDDVYNECKKIKTDLANFPVAGYEDRDNDFDLMLFTSAAEAYDFNLIFGRDNVVVKTRPLDCDEYDKFIDWLYSEFGDDSCFHRIFLDERSPLDSPTWRWRHLEDVNKLIDNEHKNVVAIAFALKNDAFLTKLKWG